MSKGKSTSEIFVGQKASVSKTITEGDVYSYAGIIGDFNPYHVNHEVGKNTKFGGRIVHGMLVGSFMSTIIGMELPGPGCLYLEQNCTWKAPTMFGDTITMEAEVTHIKTTKDGRGIITLSNKCTNQNGLVVMEGTSKAMAPSKEKSVF